MDKQAMLEKYAMHSAAHVYALGFVYSHMLYVAKLTFAELCNYCKADKASASKGGYNKVRIKLHAQDRKDLLAKAEILGTEDLLALDAKHNKGENFERELTERWTAEQWVKDSVPFWAKGDITVNGVEIQVKLDGAELTNEKTLARLG